MTDESWLVLNGSYDAATNMAIDEYLLEQAAETGQRSIRVFDFEEPAMILGRNQSYRDVTDDSITVTRRMTGGYAMYCAENGIFYSVAVPAEEAAFPEDLHRDYLGPKLAQALIDIGVPADRVGIGEHFSIRIDGKTVAGNGQRKADGAYLYHGVLAVEPWEVDYLDAALQLKERDGEHARTFIADLPHIGAYVDGTRDAVQDAFTDAFVNRVADGPVMTGSAADTPRVQELVQKYGDPDWIRSAYSDHDVEAGKGFCFVNWDEEMAAYQ